MTVKITLRQLKVFDTVASLGSVTAAANKLNMSQSAASTALSELQTSLRKVLFAHAKGRAVQITDEGKRLQPMIRSVLRQIEDIESAGEESPLCGKLVVGATSMIAEIMLPRLCYEFMCLNPAVAVKVEAGSAGDLFDRLTRYELETALIDNFPAVDDIELTHWMTDELILVAVPAHPLAQRKNLTIEDLAGVKWCTREAYSSSSSRLRYMLHQKIGQLVVAFESTSNWAVRHAVIAGTGIGCLSRHLVGPDVAAGRLVRLDVKDFEFTRSLSLARPKSVPRSRLVRSFDEFILSHREAFFDILQPP
jgi:DNA-binding transcriptional LysR family regulator